LAGAGPIQDYSRSRAPNYRIEIARTFVASPLFDSEDRRNFRFLDFAVSRTKC